MTSDRQPINANSTPEEKLDYMRTLLKAVQELDTNHDGHLSTDEFAKDDIRKYLAYRERAFLPEANKEPLKDLREDLKKALKGNANAQWNVEQALQSIQAQDPQTLRDAMAVAVTLTAPPRDDFADRRKAEHATMVEGAATNERDALDEMAKYDEVTPDAKAELDKAYADAPALAEAARADVNQQAYDATITQMQHDHTYTPEVDAVLRAAHGLPPTKAEADKLQQAEQEIADLGKTLAHYDPANVEAKPTNQQLSDAIDRQYPAPQGNETTPVLDPQQPAVRASLDQVKALVTDPESLQSIAKRMDEDHDHRISKDEVMKFVRTATDEVGYNPETNTSLNAASIQTDVQHFAEALKKAGQQQSTYDFQHLDVPDMADVQAMMSPAVPNKPERGGR